ncbi:TonB-dependent siderophore receptor [Nitrosomonas sp.]|uniref:TonB-dependent siderophore receptor n=1 Tax=Nitrosomonas sp. TaxID=42353 RepID=UPI0037C78ED0
MIIINKHYFLLPLFRLWNIKTITHLFLTVMLAVSYLSMISPVSAQQSGSTRHYHIPAGSLTTVLNDFGREAGILLSFSTELTNNLQSKGLNGNYTTQDGLAALLAGSGLEAVRTADGSYTLRGSPVIAPRSSEGTLTLPAMTVMTSGIVDPTTEDTGSYTTGSTNTSTRLPLTLRETPQSVSVITRQRMEDQGLNQLTDVVNQTTGMVYQSGGSSQSDSATFYARGFAVDNYQIDGVPQIYNNYNRIFQTNDMAIFDRVEVVRGANGLMNSVGTPGASINLIRKRPTDTFRAAARFEGGNWGYRRAEGDISMPLISSGKLRGRLVGVLNTSDSYIDREEQKRSLLYGIVEADLTPSTLATAGFMFQEQNQTANARGALPAFYSDGTRTNWGRSDTAAANWAYSKRNGEMVFVTLDHRFNEDWLARISWNRSVTKYDEVLGYALGGNPDKVTGAGVNLWAGRWNGAPVQNTLDVYTMGSFSLFGRKHDVIAGTLFSFTKDSPQSYGLWYFNNWSSSVSNIFTWDGNTPTPPPTLNTPVGEWRMDEQVISGYVTGRFRLLDSLSLIGGARVTDWKFRRFAENYATGNITRINFSQNPEIIPFAGITYDFLENWSAYASYTSIFKPQTLRSENGNFVDPLAGNSYEVGIKAAFFDNRLNLHGAIYRIQQDNLAIALPNNVLAPDGSTAYRTVSGAKTDGFEMELAGMLTRNWQASVGFAHNVTEDRNKVKLNTQVPRNTFKLFTTYRFPTVAEGLMIGGGVRWQDRIYREDQGPAKVEISQGGYTIVDLMARLEITKMVALSANLYNLFDEKYYQTVPASYYGAPRNVRVALNIRF